MAEAGAPARRESARQTELTQAPVFTVVGDRTLIFSEARQAIYELSDLAAYVWRSLDAGMSADGISSELVRTGVDPDEAQGAVADTLEQIRTLRTTTTVPAAQSLAAVPERLARRTILIADVAVQLTLSKELVADVEAVFGALITDLPDADAQLCARAAGDCVHFFSPGQPDWSCDRAQFIPLLKAQLIDSVLACAQYEVAMHAAALVGQEDAVLLVGSPGAGKTTLAIALEKAGFEVMADDVVLLDEKGLITGLSFPFTAKASAWPLLSQYWPGIVAHPSHCRPDGQTLCYIPLAPDCRPAPPAHRVRGPSRPPRPGPRPH